MNDDNRISCENSLSFEPVQPSTITFTLGIPVEEIIKISEEGFFYKGKLVVDDHEIYLKFKEWLDSANNLSKAKSEPLNFNSIEERDNVIALMQEALKFYRDKSHYTPTTFKNFIQDRYLTAVEIDCGYQASFALQKADELMAQNEKIQNDYDKIMAENLDMYYPVTNVEDIETTIKLNKIISEQESMDNLAKMRKQGNENPIV